ncbi:MAG: DNA (cytosine-5-)-methyltransferase [Gloeocapsa sp. UFS-A4-WI-NPMV-4B04]|jgi:DNA (cytosine-5)-methyltransferase 1|nr:DNA (cytosine-5-)-methyltransferase [Gloeocapsa sp. UFS-A4-WI-NPMV-4B04]
MKTFASLFSGGGGADIGAAMAQFQPIWGIELDPDIASVFAANLGHQPIVKSVAEVNPNSLDRPDVLWAPPCQEWSVARSKSLPKRVDADIGYAIIPFLKTLQPKTFILENVEAYRKARVFHAIVNVLHQLGYWTTWSVLNTADWGVPQTRRRLILRAVKDGFVPPLPPVQKWRGWYEAVADLIPTLPESQFAAWQIRRMPVLAQTSLVESRNTIRRSTVRSFDKPAPCVTTTWLHRPCVIPRAFIVDDTGASSSSYAKELVHGSVVAMTPRALARFQSFPDSYQLPESRRLASRVIGNAVPPLFAQKLLEGIASS